MFRPSCFLSWVSRVMTKIAPRMYVWAPGSHGGRGMLYSLTLHPGLGRG